MAGYATVEDVQRRMPQFTLTETSKPSIETAATFIEDSQATLDGALGNLGYIIPITGPNSLRQVREIVCQCTIAKILYARAAAVGTDVAVTSADRAQKMCDDAYAKLADPDNPIDLSDAGVTDDFGSKSEPILMGGPHYDECTGCKLEPRIRMNSKF